MCPVSMNISTLSTARWPPAAAPGATAPRRNPPLSKYSRPWRLKRTAAVIHCHLPFAPSCVSLKCLIVFVISGMDEETLVAFLNEDQANKDGNVHKGREGFLNHHSSPRGCCLSTDGCAKNNTVNNDSRVVFCWVADGASEAASLSAAEARESAGRPCREASAASRRALFVALFCGDPFKHPVTGIFVCPHSQSWKKPSKEVW